MKTLLIPTKTIVLSVLLFGVIAAQGQDKDIAKVDSYIAKAKETTDPAKKTDYYNKAASLIMTARLPKSENIKIGDAYLEDGDVNSAIRFYMRCDKEDKNAGYVKVGHKLIEQAFDDPKTEVKTMSNAIKNFTKGGAAAEGYEAVGDAYYNKGEDYYGKAADYYAQGKISAKIDKVAGEYEAANKPKLAAETYMKLDTEEGYKKAGDLYYSIGDYNSAFTAYDKGGIADGIKKYADKLYSEGETSDANALYNKVAEIYGTKGNTAALGEMAKAKEESGEFDMAATFYEKSGEANKAVRAKAYSKLVSFEFDEAVAQFTAIGDMDMIKAIGANTKYLTPLKDAAYYFDEVKQNEPPVTYTEDPETHKKVPSSAEVQALKEYYEAAIGAIVDNCYTVAANVTKITNPAIKDAMMKRFKQYGAIRNVLDANFGKKLDKSTATAKDVRM